MNAQQQPEDLFINRDGKEKTQSRNLALELGITKEYIWKSPKVQNSYP